jgi:hypothetical protein
VKVGEGRTRGSLSLKVELAWSAVTSARVAARSFTTASHVNSVRHIRTGPLFPFPPNDCDYMQQRGNMFMPMIHDAWAAAVGALDRSAHYQSEGSEFAQDGRLLGAKFKATFGTAENLRCGAIHSPVISCRRRRTRRRLHSTVTPWQRRSSVGWSTLASPFARSPRGSGNSAQTGLK